MAWEKVTDREQIIRETKAWQERQRILRRKEDSKKPTGKDHDWAKDFYGSRKVYNNKNPLEISGLAAGIQVTEPDIFQTEVQEADPEREREEK
jgi:hypothetical protein